MSLGLPLAPELTHLFFVLLSPSWWLSFDLLHTNISFFPVLYLLLMFQAPVAAP